MSHRESRRLVQCGMSSEAPTGGQAYQSVKHLLLAFHPLFEYGHLQLGIGTHGFCFIGSTNITA